jgi:hypothetical protein
MQSAWLTPKLQQLAISRFNNEFGKSFEKWEAYCGRLTQSSFLRGEKGPDEHNWRPNIAWAIQPDTVLKEAEGRYVDSKVEPVVEVKPRAEFDPLNDPIWGKPNRIKLRLASEAVERGRDDPLVQQLLQEHQSALAEAKAAQAALQGTEHAYG